MRRIVTWVASTVAVVVLLFGYHTSTEGTRSPGDSIVVSAPTPSPSTGTSSGTSNNRAAGGKATTGLGDVSATRWGPVQVQISTDGTRITAVSVPRYPTGNQRDQQINAQALPILVKETLAQQSANIDMVSGATVTSTGYRESLQSAIDQANL